MTAPTKVACPGCVKGIDMCRTRPCWGTPEEIKAIKAAGFGDRLMLDWWEGGPNGRTMIPAPAIKGYEGQHAPKHPTGRCTFLTFDDKCELHARGLKPSEGAVACCNVQHDDMHHAMAKTWHDRQEEAVL